MATPNTSGAINRITKEIASLQRSPDVSLAVAFQEKDVRHSRALIIGPPETPYEYGFYEFAIKFTKDYPIKPPHVRGLTTNSGRTRFNPNIYADGKVCLSILGTWRGERGEQWSSAQGLESVLLSIQSLMSSNPYENEPGYENTPKESEDAQKYAAKICHENLRVSVIQRLERLMFPEEPSGQVTFGHLNDSTPNATQHGSSHFGDGLTPNWPSHFGDGLIPLPDGNTDSSITSDGEPGIYESDAEAIYNALDSCPWDPFGDLLKRRFLWYYDTYMKNIQHSSKLQCDGNKFVRTSFEFDTNAMQGKFEYDALKPRLERLLDALNNETASWVDQGVQLVKGNTQIATQLAFQFKQLEHRWNKSQYPGTRMEISLPNAENPFVWQLTLFGQPQANLDGGIFNMTLSIPPNFPEAQPRVRLQTPIFHRQVNSIGTLCYFPQKSEEISSHLDAIVASIDDANPSYDPRAMVNPEAFSLYWGGEEKRKIYKRRLRRSAQSSSEY